MKKIYSFVFSQVLLLLSATLSAQSLRIPYQMDFETSESTELSNWVLNPGADAAACKDKWMVGPSVHSSGAQALYISSNGQDAIFGVQPNVQYAYRPLPLPAGTFDLTFDWMCIGAEGSSLYIGYEDFSDLNLSARANSGVLPTSATNDVRGRMLQNYLDLKGQDQWSHASIRIQSDGVTPVSLVFAWANKNTDSTKVNIGACIDNIQITSTNCQRPTDIVGQVISCDSVLVTWQGRAGDYQFAYRAAGTDAWHSRHDISVNGTQGSIILTNMTEGSYDFRVRGICTPDTSAWTVYTGYVVFCPELHCVNFTDLTAPSVTCTYGTTDRSYSDPSDRAHAYDNVGIVDYGSESILSRHTVNWDKTAYDPMTGGNLKVIPDGGYASVRLGNWQSGNGAESITYEYVVDSSSAVLLMKYAVVLEDPEGHGEDSPRFLLEILDENGNLLDNTCGKRNFVATDVDRSEWHSYRPAGSYENVVYKDWSTIGMNLSEIGVADGQRIKVRLTTYDCFWSAHFGYAYFTLDCARAVIETAACADDHDMKMTLEAPEGFTYAWYKLDTLKSTDRVFYPNDTATYRCVITSTEIEDCKFELYSQCMPRRPMPDFTPVHTPMNCQNKMTMHNESFIRIVLKSGIIDEHKRCDDYFWVIGGTSASGEVMLEESSDREHPEFLFPDEGGEYYARLKASLNGSCERDTTIYFHVPAIAPYYRNYSDTICEGQWIKWIGSDGRDTTLSTPGVYSMRAKTLAGCDSILEMHLTVNPRYDMQLSDTTLCYGETLMVGDSLFDTKVTGPGAQQMWRDWNMKSSCGCDSTVWRYVTVLNPILPIITCGDSILNQPFHRIDMNPGQNTVDLSVSGTGFDSFNLEYIGVDGKRKSESYGASAILKDLPINEYVFVFRNDDGCDYIDTVLVGGDTICVEDILPSAQIQCNCGTAVLWIPYEKCRPYNKARLNHANVNFTAPEAVMQGFRDTTIFGLREKDTIRIAVPKSAEPGTYKVDVIFDTIIGGAIWGQNAFHTSITLTYDSSVIFHRWNENAIISLKNASTAKKADGSAFSGYEFTEFQWLHNGEEVAGANLSYMEQQGLLNMSDRYQLRLNRADGAQFTTCAYVPGTAAPAPSMRIDGVDDAVELSATLLSSGEDVILSLRDEADVEIYSTLGARLYAGHLTAGAHTLSAPVAPGIYIMSVRIRGEVLNIRLQVR